MEALYKTVYDLNRAELEELKFRIFFDDCFDEEIFDGIESPDQIPDDVVYYHFEDINFVDEDFWCNVD